MIGNSGNNSRNDSSIKSSYKSKVDDNNNVDYYYGAEDDGVVWCGVMLCGVV